MLGAEENHIDSGRYTTNSQFIQFGPWHISYDVSCILPSVCSTKVVCKRDDNQFCQFCIYCKELEIPHFPDMVFPKNTLTLTHNSGAKILFSPLDALRKVSCNMDAIKVACAEAWQESRPDAETPKRTFDWTFSTDYRGTLTNNIIVEPTDETINLDILKRKEQILFYHDLTLFEDELHDHGISKLSVKIRVMPSYWYVLLRHFLRIDDVLVRAYETRMFHLLNTDYVLREFSIKEAKSSDLKIPTSLMKEADDVLPILPVKEKILEKLIINIIVFDLNFENALIAQQGLGWPVSIHVAKGNEALMKLSLSLDDYDSCTVVPPSGVKFDVRSPPSSRYSLWGDFCGVRVRNVTFQDEGRWRLTSTKGSDSRTGWVEVHVLKDKPTFTAPPISLQDGQTHTTLNLSSVENAYCVVAKPFSESSLVPGNCTVTLDRTTRAVQGNWQIYLGLPGRVTEIQTKRQVTVQTERLNVGYVTDADHKLHLYCNILHTTKNITFCRFQRTSNSYGYNVIDGLSDGTHSYYGEGFALKQCGMTIERPNPADYGTWRCSVGVQMFVGNAIVQQPTLQALISVPNTMSSFSYRNQDIGDSSEPIFIQEESQFTLRCKAEVSLTYCWFQHPNGTQFTPVGQADDDQLFWYTGEGLDVGDCGITFKNASQSDDGNWSCHMGPSNSLGVELTDKLQVRVTGSLAANVKEIGLNIGYNATLYCHTANGRRPLKYCRFLSPTFVGMNMDSSITEQNAIFNRFYFTPEREINFGDCSLNIVSIKMEDIGEWTCGAVVDNEVLESRDFIRLYITENKPILTQAGIIGMSVGLSILVVILVGYLSYKKGWIRRIQNLRQVSNNTTMSDSFSLQNRFSQISGSSGSSAENPVPSA